MSESGWQKLKDLGDCENWATKEERLTFSVDTFEEEEQEQENDEEEEQQDGNSLSIRGVKFLTVEEELMFESDEEFMKGEKYDLSKLPITPQGEKCTGPQIQNCTNNPCPVDCQVEWNQPSACNTSCGAGWKTTTYNITRHPNHGGKSCEANKTEECNTPCHCKIHEWTLWSSCSTTCGDGERKRTPKNITENPDGMGKIRFKVGNGTNHASDISRGIFKLRLYDGKSTDGVENCSTGLIF